MIIFIQILALASLTMCLSTCTKSDDDFIEEDDVIEFSCRELGNDNFESCEDILTSLDFGRNRIWDLWRFWNYSTYYTIGGTWIQFGSDGIYSLEDNEDSAEVKGNYKLNSECSQIIFEGLSSSFSIDSFEILLLDAQKMLLWNSTLCADTCLLIPSALEEDAWMSHCNKNSNVSIITM